MQLVEGDTCVLTLNEKFTTKKHKYLNARMIDGKGNPIKAISKKNKKSKGEMIWTSQTLSQGEEDDRKR